MTRRVRKQLDELGNHNTKIVVGLGGADVVNFRFAVAVPPDDLNSGRTRRRRDPADTR